MQTYSTNQAAGTGPRTFIAVRSRQVSDGNLPAGAGAVIRRAWELFARAHRLTGGVSTLLEWDAKIPEFPVLHAEVLKAKKYMAQCAIDDTESASEPVVHDEPRGRRSVPQPLAFLVPETD